MTRSLATAALAAALAFVPLTAPAGDPLWASGATDTSHDITVYRSASCGCCKGWVGHLREHNFAVEEVILDDVSAVKQRLGVAPELASCHTAISDGHVFEGHVPAADIKAVLESDDSIRLLAVPAMPSGTPGMDFPGAPKQDFDVIAEDTAGERRVYRTYAGY